MERIIPEKVPAAWREQHLERYRFASAFVSERKVLDAACGVGYGCAVLAASGVSQVVGVDISADACHYGKSRYTGHFIAADVQHLPFPKEYFDVIVSFETVEHIPSVPQFVESCAFSLKSNGLLIISTPNGRIYPDANPYHYWNFTRAEFLALLEPYFSVEELLGQKYELYPKILAKRFIGRIASQLGVKMLLKRLLTRPDSCDVSSGDVANDQYALKTCRKGLRLHQPTYFVAVARRK